MTMKMCRALTAAQINENRGEALYRPATVRSIDEESRTVELSFSSEEPVQRWFGEEILVHDSECVRLDRLNAGGPCLVGHDWNDQIGIIESAVIDGRTGRAIVRFGKSKRADEIYQDVVDGIRKNVSVGYQVFKLEQEQREGLPDLVRVIDWEPYEISIVAVPADLTVGVGRILEESPNNEPEGEKPMNEKVLRHNGDLVRALVNENGEVVEVKEVLERAGEDQRTATQAERQRSAEIHELGERFGVSELAREAVKSGTSVAAFQTQVLESMNDTRGLDESSSGADVGLSDNEIRDYSFVRAIRALANPNDRRAQEEARFEIEASDAAQKKLGRDAAGILVPNEVLSRAFNSGVGAATTNDTGGNLIATELATASFIDLLRIRTVLMQLGRPMTGLVGNVDIPRQNSGSTGYWVGEHEDAGETGPGIGQIGLTPKTAAAFTDITRKLMQQSSNDVESFIRSDLAKALAQTIDKAGFYGSGSGNEPTGIANTTGINAVLFGADTKPGYAKVVEMETTVAADNADAGSLAYVTNTTNRGHFKTAQKFEGTNGVPVWEPGNTVNGTRTEVTNQITSNDVFYGNWSDLIIGLWGGLDLTVDTSSLSKKGGVRVVVFQDVDFAVRHPESFCLGRSA